jgi:hypothetical protein
MPQCSQNANASLFKIRLCGAGCSRAVAYRSLVVAYVLVAFCVVVGGWFCCVVVYGLSRLAYSVFLVHVPAATYATKR